MLVSRAIRLSGYGKYEMIQDRVTCIRGRCSVMEKECMLRNLNMHISNMEGWYEF